MIRLRNAGIAAFTAAALALSAPALASGDPHAGDATEEHGEGDHHGGHHADYRGDKDGDGIPNWIDWSNNLDPEDANDEFVGLDLLFHAINFGILLAILFFAGRRPIGDFLKSRALAIRKELTDSARQRDEAKSKYDELEARLTRFEDEVAQMKAEAAIEARAEEEALVERAHDAAKRVGEMAERNIRDEVVRAQVALRREAVDLAVQLAEKTLRSHVGSDDNKRLAREFLDSLSDNGMNGHG